LVFEQVLADGSVVNIELPRDNPFVPSSGNGLTAPVSPGGGATSITLRVSLFDLINGRVYDLREIILPVLAAGATPTVTSAPAPDIRTFTLDAANLNANELANGTSRVVVHWAVVNRPANSNLVFEQILSNGTVVNVELPRSNPIVASEGAGLIAPRAPGGNATSARFILTLIGLNNGTVYDRVEVTLPIVTPPTLTPTPTGTAQGYNLTLTSPISSIGRQEIAAGGRIEVSWSVSPRPANTNLFFEQVLPDGSAYNVELPRPNPYVPSAGIGAVAPIVPPENVNQIVIRVRLATFTGPANTLAQRELIIPLAGESNVTPTPRRFDVFTPSNLVIENSQIAGGSVIIPVSWNVTQRPTNSNLVFEQVFPNGSFVNAELPRPDPIVPSAGTGAVLLRDPGASVTEVRVRVRLIQLNGSQVFDQRELVIPIAGRGPVAAPTTAATVTNQTPESTAEATPEAQSVQVTTCPNTWFVPTLQGCPSSPAERFELTMQQFETGLMLYYGNQVYLLTLGGTVIIGQPGTFDGLTEPPSGYFAPSAIFAALWGANQELAGWATTPEGSYLATIQSSADALVLTLPDGRAARLTPASNPTTWENLG
jgi:ribosomal protein S8E